MPAAFSWHAGCIRCACGQCRPHRRCRVFKQVLSCTAHRYLPTPLPPDTQTCYPPATTNSIQVAKHSVPPQLGFLVLFDLVTLVCLGDSAQTSLRARSRPLLHPDFPTETPLAPPELALSQLLLTSESYMFEHSILHQVLFQVLKLHAEPMKCSNSWFLSVSPP